MYDQFTSQLPDPRLYNEILQGPASGDEDATDMLNLGKMENTRDILATENIASATRLLNYELAHFGYPPIKLDPESEDSHQIVQTFFALLGQQHTSRSFREEYEDRMHRLIFDHKHAVNSVARLKEKLDLSLRETESLKLELKEANREIKNEKEKVRFLQEDLKQTRSNHLHAKSQFAHDLRKKDVEVTRAKERAQKIIADKYKAAKLGLTALNLPPKAPSSSSKTNDEDYYVTLVRSYASREEHLLDGYHDLAEALGTLYKTINNHFSPGKDKAPFDPALLHPETSIQPVLNSIDELAIRIKSGKPPVQTTTTLDSDQLEKQAVQIASLTSEVAALESDIEQYRQKVSEQDAQLQESKQCEEPKQIAQAKLTSERASLEKDRAKITKLALLLGQEKAQFAKDKEALEKEREQFETLKALDAQDTPQWLLDMDLSRHSLDNLSDDDEEATLAQLLQEGGNISNPTPLSPIKKSRSRQDLDLTSAKSHQNIKAKMPANKLPLQKTSSRSNSTLTRPTAAALLKAQATQARLIQRRDSKLKQASSIAPVAPRIQSTCKTPNGALRTKSKPLSSTNLNLTS